MIARAPRTRASLVAVALPLLAGLTASLDGGLARADGPSAAAPATPPAVRRGRVRDALSGDALKAFDRGAVLFSDGDFGGARAEFERAHLLSHDPRVLYNVAVCEKSLRKYARAIASLRASLEEGRGTLARDYIDKVDDTVKALEPFVTTLTIACEEPGAAVFIDDENVGVTPLASPVPIEVGEHVVSVRKTGYLDLPTKVVVTSGQPKSIRVALDPAVKRGTVHVGVAGISPSVHPRVLVDGVEVGDAPWTGTVDAGRHTFTVRAPELVTGQRMEDVAFGSDTRVTFTMERERHEARLHVTTDDDDSAVVLDGKVVGHGRFDGAVPSGEHQLRVTRPGAEPNARDFVLRDNESRTFNVTLDPKRGGVPAWVWITGGIVVASGVTTAVVFATRQTTYDGSAPGTLTPGFVPANYRFGGVR